MRKLQLLARHKSLKTCIPEASHRIGHCKQSPTFLGLQDIVPGFPWVAAADLQPPQPVATLAAASLDIQIAQVDYVLPLAKLEHHARHRLKANGIKVIRERGAGWLLGFIGFSGLEYIVFELVFEEFTTTTSIVKLFRPTCILPSPP